MSKDEIVTSPNQLQFLSLEVLAVHAGLHPRMVQRCVEFGLIQPAEREGALLYFDASIVPRLRMISRLRNVLGINLAGTAVILDLLDRLRVLQRENKSLRSQL